MVVLDVMALPFEDLTRTTGPSQTPDSPGLVKRICAEQDSFNLYSSHSYDVTNDDQSHAQPERHGPVAASEYV